MIPSILWSAPVPPAAKHPHNMMLPPRASLLWWCYSACKPPRFSSKHNNGHYDQTVPFLFHLCPHVQLQTVVWLCFMAVLEQWLLPCWAAFQVLSDMGLVWWLRGPMVFILAYYCLYRWTWYLHGVWKLLPRMNQTCGGLYFFWGLGWFLLISPWCQAEALSLKVGLEIHPGTPPIDSHDVN